MAEIITAIIWIKGKKGCIKELKDLLANYIGIKVGIAENEGENELGSTLGLDKFLPILFAGLRRKSPEEVEAQEKKAKAERDQKERDHFRKPRFSAN